MLGISKLAHPSSLHCHPTPPLPQDRQCRWGGGAWAPPPPPPGRSKGVAGHWPSCTLTVCHTNCIRWPIPPWLEAVSSPAVSCKQPMQGALLILAWVPCEAQQRLPWCCKTPTKHAILLCELKLSHTGTQGFTDEHSTLGTADDPC